MLDNGKKWRVISKGGCPQMLLQGGCGNWGVETGAVVRQRVKRENDIGKIKVSNYFRGLAPKNLRCSVWGG